VKNIRCDRITSRKNPKIISACALSDKKVRDLTGLFAAEGIKLLREILYENIKITDIYHTKSAAVKFSEELEKADMSGANIYEVSDEVYDKLSEEKNPEGIFTSAKKFPVYPHAAQTPGKGGFVILDSIQNPLNIGAIIRAAAALGVERILLGEGCADIFGRKTIRAAMGALFKVNICVCSDICKELGQLKKSGSRIFASALGAESTDIRNIKFSPDDCIVIGNEGSGISEKVLNVCDKKIIIPMQQNTESLNAASAASILIWEKQKGVIE
jgi:TrmH family RNA methyltransferase